MSVLFFGDIVGNPGRLALKQQLPAMRERYRPDLIIANVENIANGTGLTPELYKKLSAIGIDGMTLGDHVFKKVQIVPTLENAKDLIRPANLSPKAPGQGAMVLQPKDEQGNIRRDLPRVHVITVLGRLFMSQLPANDPFACVDAYLNSLKDDRAIVLIEIHGEASSEKVAMGWHVNGRATAVVGTHTHIPTADHRLLPHTFAEDDDAASRGPVRRSAQGGAVGTAYITDLGMTGPQDSVLGRRVDRVLKQMTTNTYAAFDVAVGKPQINGVWLTVDIQSGLCSGIERVCVDADVACEPFV